MNSSEAHVAAVPSRRRLPCSVTLWSLAVLGGGCGVLPNAPTVQRLPSIGYLSPGPRDEYADRVEAFSGGLHDVVRQSVDVIVTGGLTPPALGAKPTTTSIPIVFAGETGPAETGIVLNLAHPGGNVRGVSSCVPGVEGRKYLELLRDMLPDMTSAADILPAALDVKLPESLLMQATEVVR